MTNNDTLHENKEHVYKELQETGKKIASLITELKERREKRNDLTRTAQEQKTVRKDLSKVIKEKIVEVKTLREKLPARPVQAPSRDSREERDRMTPGKLKEEIARIETKLETSAMAFTEEQKLTKILKEKKALLAKMGGASDLEHDVRARSKEIDKLKKESDVAHDAVTKAAKESQEHHEAILAISKQIEELKIKENTLRDEYQAAKNELAQHHEELPSKKPSRRERAPMAPPQTSAEDKAVLKEKAAEVEQKVKDKKKLTTEDLLAFQAHK